MTNLYIYKGKEYRLLYDDLEVKNSISRKWQKGVLYEQVESSLLFVRESEEFFKLFNKVI